MGHMGGPGGCPEEDEMKSNLRNQSQAMIYMVSGSGL